jgi:hypothetical protein
MSSVGSTARTNPAAGGSGESALSGTQQNRRQNFNQGGKTKSTDAPQRDKAGLKPTTKHFSGKEDIHLSIRLQDT